MCTSYTFDDSGSAGNKDEKHLVLGGVCVFERQVHWLSQELDTLAARLQGGATIPLEFHASEIWSARREPWKSLTTLLRRQAISDVLSVLANCRGTTVAFACVVEKAAFPAADPMAMAFEALIHRFDVMLRRVYTEDQDAQRGLLILDESAYETALQQLATTFRRSGTKYASLVNIVDVPLFVDSKASRMIQLADHIAYSVFRRHEAGDSLYLDVFAHKFDRNSNGRMNGLVHLTNNRQCCCLACVSTV